MTDVATLVSARSAVSVPGRLAIAAACVLALCFGGRALGDESRTVPAGDPARYLMNGAYFSDLLHDRPFGSLDQFVQYTRLYYGRYPALSLGHHPLLLSLAEAPLFAVFGMSVTAGRIVVLLCFTLAVLLLGALMSRLFGEVVGGVAALLLATNPHFIAFGQAVMSEMTGAAFVVATAYFLHRTCETWSRRDIAAAAGSIVLALYGKHLTVFALCGLLAYALLRAGWRRLLTRDVIVAAACAALLVAPLVPITLDLSRSNVGFVRSQAVGRRHHVSFVSRIATRAEAVRYAIATQFTPPMWVLIAAGIIVALWRRDDGSVLLLCWLGGVAAGLVFVTVSLEPPRYSLYWTPALVGLVAALMAGISWTRARTVAAVALSLALVVQTVWASGTEPKRAAGIEETARFVTSQPRGATVLYSGEIASGLFVFFVRKHDPGRQQIVLRADKVLATSFLQTVSADRIARPEQVYDVLNTYGTRYIVVEDRPARAQVINWVRQVVHSTRFRERYRVKVETTDARLQGSSLAVYEYQDARQPTVDTKLDMQLPLVGRQLDLRLGDLLDRRLLR